MTPPVRAARPLRFCILTTAHVCNNPRVVKEADALHAAGHHVRVVAYDSDADAARRDRALMQGRSWRLAPVAVHARSPALRVRWALAGVRHVAAKAAFDHGLRPALVRDFALGKHLLRMAAAASAEPADVIVAHHAPALPAAARAARRIGASLVFDFEDYHAGDLQGEGTGPADARRIEAVDRAYLPACRAITASSPAIADVVSTRYGVRRPTVVLNTFPRDEWRAPTAVDDRVGDAPSFYWFSQVIGPNRGLELAVTAAARAQVPLQLHLRGVVAPDFARRLHDLAAEHGLRGSLHLHEPAPPAELVAICARHDVGLAVEQPVSENRLLSISNKFFTYMNAGNALVASDTPGQRGALEHAPGAALLCALGDVDAMAGAIRTFATDPAALQSARRASREAAERRYCWEHEAPILVRALEDAS